ncbi:NUDIX domain-containing protein [Bacillus salacetis]|uniref:NUDIX domain-containing protein n=1 Tax=Bacillus salacetis TaxID=2315464 RepID=UPI003B9F7DBC
MSKPFHHLARGIFVMDNKVLLAQAKGYPNTFLPGGHVEVGESAKDALSREIKEELNMDVEAGDFLGLIEHQWSKNGVMQYEINQVFSVNGFDVNAKNPTPNEAHLEFFWCPVSELDERNLQPFSIRNLIRNYLSGNEKAWWVSSINSDI